MKYKVTVIDAGKEIVPSTEVEARDNVDAAIKVCRAAGVTVTDENQNTVNAISVSEAGNQTSTNGYIIRNHLRT